MITLFSLNDLASSKYATWAVNLVTTVLTDPAYCWILATLVLNADAFLTQLIIRFIRYTEIDWETYMVQAELFAKGERNYSFIEGPTGPAVYPAGHLYIHEALRRYTSLGTNIVEAQQLYGVLYIISQAIVCSLYIKSGSIPNWLLLFLPASKRLHSIFVLRMFNDCWSVVASQAAILAFCEGLDTLGSLLFSLALSVKMSVLLYLPGLGIILWRRHGIVKTLYHLLLIASIQIEVAAPFLRSYPWQYVNQAFDFSRIFLFKWTVNWRFLGEELFLDPTWTKALLVAHLVTVLAFAHFKWCQKDGGLIRLIFKTLQYPAKGLAPNITPDYVFTVMATSNLIGIVFARSLHYQFYSWYAQQIPFLAWRTKLPLYFRIFLIVAIEYAWNVYPSTNFSSVLLVASNSALLTGLWFGWPSGMADTAIIHKDD